MGAACLLSGCLLSACSASPSDPGAVDVGQGFESEALHAPWSGLDNDTRFCCHSTAERFFFQFVVRDSTLTLTHPYTGERDVDPADRVEIFFARDAQLKKPYYCAEIDAAGHVMDYKAKYYRKFDFGWNFRTLEVRSLLSFGTYRIAGSISRQELKSLGMDMDRGFWMGVFQGEAGEGRDILWYSLVPTDDQTPDFHQPKVFFPCRMTPKAERRGVVVYPGDISSLGLEEWEKRIRLSGINLIGLHAATSNDPIDNLETFIRSGLGQDFLALCQREGVDVEYELHALETLLPRSLFAAHPEYFRMDDQGKRVADYNLCFTSDEVIEAIRPQLERLLTWMKPTTHRYFLWPDDKEHRYCHCERCAAYSPSEQTLCFENRLLSLLREYDPQATLAHLAYHQTLQEPVRVRPAEGIFLEFAPILRDYAEPLSEDQQQMLQANLLVFPAYSQHILEYWLDESMNARWKRDSRPALPFEPAWCARDVAMYRDFGAASLTNFATWLDGAYVAQHGATDSLFTAFASAF